MQVGWHVDENVDKLRLFSTLNFGIEVIQMWNFDGAIQSQKLLLYISAFGRQRSKDGDDRDNTTEPLE